MNRLPLRFALWPAMGLLLALAGVASGARIQAVTPPVQFLPAVTYLTGNPGNVHAADVDGDTNLDIVLDQDTSIAVLYGLGDGTFGEQRQYPVDSVRLTEVQTADVNRDGRLDLVVADMNGHKVHVLTNLGNRQFTAADSYRIAPEGEEPQARGVKVGDLNGDSYPDIVAIGHRNRSLVVFFNNGDGTFGGRVRYFEGTRPTRSWT